VGSPSGAADPSTSGSLGPTVLRCQRFDVVTIALGVVPILLSWIPWGLWDAHRTALALSFVAAQCVALAIFAFRVAAPVELHLDAAALHRRRGRSEVAFSWADCGPFEHTHRWGVWWVSFECGHWTVRIFGGPARPRVLPRARRRFLPWTVVRRDGGRWSPEAPVDVKALLETYRRADARRSAR